METFLAKTFQIPFHSLSLGGEEELVDMFGIIFFKRVSAIYPRDKRTMRPDRRVESNIPAEQRLVLKYLRIWPELAVWRPTL